MLAFEANSTHLSCQNRLFSEFYLIVVHTNIVIFESYFTYTSKVKCIENRLWELIVKISLRMQKPKRLTYLSGPWQKPNTYFFSIHKCSRIDFLERTPWSEIFCQSRIRSPVLSQGWQSKSFLILCTWVIRISLEKLKISEFPGKSTFEKLANRVSTCIVYIFFYVFSKCKTWIKDSMVFWYWLQGL